MTDRSRVVQMPLGKDRKKSQSQSQSESSRTDRYHKPSLASLNPDTFVPPFDVLNELAHNKEHYSGEEPLTIYAFPDHLRTSLDRIRAHVLTPNKPGISPAITCCMTYGLETLFEHDDIAVLLKLKDEFDHTECKDAWLVEEVASTFRHFSLSLPDVSLSQSRKQNVLLTEAVKKDMNRLATDTGAAISTIAILATMIPLIDQPCIMQERRNGMEETCTLFLKKAKIRRTVIEALMQIIR